MGITSSRAMAQTALDAYHALQSKEKAAAALGIPSSNFRRLIATAERLRLKPGKFEMETHTHEGALMRDQIRKLESQIAAAKRETISDEYVKRKIIGLCDAEPTVPAWMTKAKSGSVDYGVPTLFASDWHWGEVVNPRQIGGVNEFDMSIAQDRAREMISKTVMLCKNQLGSITYPGIVFALGGDMVSGDIHEELVATNEAEIMPTVIDLWGVLIWCIETLADEFGNVFVPCVTGNHGRNTHKIRAKGRNYTSFDWLLYQFLAKHFEDDKRIRFLIPDGPDAYYAIYGHRYLLTHGDQFRGGDGMIGALGPIIRGDHKKRSRNAQIDLEYDTMLVGHWHQLIQLQRLIVNGSLKGYDEYANQNNFPFEPPRQALWITHPKYGITFTAPVLVDKVEERRKPGPWVAWK